MQLVFGRSNSEDEIVDTGVESLHVGESYDGGGTASTPTTSWTAQARSATRCIVPANDLLISLASSSASPVP